MPESAEDGAAAGVCAPAVGPAMIASDRAASDSVGCDRAACDSAVNPRTLMEEPLSFGAGELHRLAQQPPVQPGTACVVTQSTLAEPAYGERVDAVFLGLHARRQARLVVVRRHRNTRLNDRRAAVESFGYEMHRRAVLGLVCLEDAPVCMQTWKFGQQRRMDVQYLSLELRHELRGQDAHESGEHD